MEQNSQAEKTEQIDILESQIRECFGRVVYSHKTQEKCADIVLTLHKRLKLSLILISAVVTTSLLIKLFGDQEWALMLGVVLSTILFGLNTYMKDYDLGEISQKHTNAANELWDIRETYLSLLTDIKANQLSINQIINLRDDLQKRLFNIYSGSPRTNFKAYKEASKALKINEDLTFSDKEIDAFLPKELRRTM
ncbi:MAG: SLATT domain-containing protein [Bacteroidota bacterium]